MSTFSGAGALLIDVPQKSFRPAERKRLSDPKPEVIPEPPQVPAASRSHLDVVVGAVCRHFGVTRQKLFTDRRFPDIIYMRHVAFYLTCEMTNIPIARIGRILADYDHSTLLRASRLVKGRLAAGNVRLSADIAAIREIACEIEPALREMAP